VATRAALWAKDPSTARDRLARFERLRAHGRAVHMTSLTFSAGIAALEGRTSEAISQYHDALQGWAELGLPWDQALAGIDMAMTLGPDEPAVAAAATTTRTILESLGANGMLARLDAALSSDGANRERAKSSTGRRAGASV